MLRNTSPDPRAAWRRGSRFRWMPPARAAAALIGLGTFGPPATTAAQSTSPPAQPPAARAGGSGGEPASIDTLVARALVVHPAIRATSLRVDAARARVRPAAAWPDPMLMAGVQNLPLSGEEQRAAPGSAASMATGPDPMTMKMVGVTQTVPFPGKVALQRRVAEHEVAAAAATLDAARRGLVRDVKDSYYELAFVDRALEIVERNRGVLVSLIQVTETRYGAGAGGQQDVLKARVEASRLAEMAVSLTEQRTAALARLNAMLDRPGETAVPRPAVPNAIARLAVSDSARDIRFVSASLGARAAGSPFPPLGDLQDRAVRQSPELRAQQAMIAAQAARAELARKDVLPDIDVSLQYGQRTGYPDMLTAAVSVPLPVQRHHRQDQLAKAAAAELASLEAERHAKQNQVRAEVARLASELERHRAQLALYVKAVLPQGRASLASATASYQVGRVEFLTVLDNQATLFTYETEYFRALTEFARTLAELERVVGSEVLP
jgi:cobalt-zinc-cadmium efflux system outer membrane protein